MIKLPFHFDSPLATGVFTLTMSLLLVFLWCAYPRNMLVGRALRWYFQRRFSSLGAEKANTVARGSILALIVVFGSIAAVGLSVGCGLVKNGDDPPRLAVGEARPTTLGHSVFGICAGLTQSRLLNSRYAVQQGVGALEVPVA